MINKFIEKIKNKKLVAEELSSWLGDIKVKKITVYRESDFIYVAEYIIGDKKYIGKIRFDNEINTAKTQHSNLIKINKLTKNKLNIPQELFYSNNLEAFFYNKIEGTSLEELIEAKKPIDNKFLKLAVDWIINLEKISLSKNTKLNPQFKPEYILNETTKNSKHDKEISELIKTIYKLRLKFQLKRAYLCHNDYQPQNIFFDNNQVAAIDFDNSILDDPMIDFTNLYIQLRYGGKTKKEELEKYRKYIFKYYRSKTKIKENFEERFRLYLAIASVKNLNKHLVEKNKARAKHRINKIRKNLLFFNE